MTLLLFFTTRVNFFHINKYIYVLYAGTYIHLSILQITFEIKTNYKMNEIKTIMSKTLPKQIYMTIPSYHHHHQHLHLPSVFSRALIYF